MHMLGRENRMSGEGDPSRRCPNSRLSLKQGIAVLFDNFSAIHINKRSKAWKLPITDIFVIVNEFIGELAKFQPSDVFKLLRDQFFVLRDMLYIFLHTKYFSNDEYFLIGTLKESDSVHCLCLLIIYSMESSRFRLFVIRLNE